MSPLLLIPSSAFASWFTWFFHVTSTLKSGANLCFSLGFSHVWDDFTSLPRVPEGHCPGLPRSASFMDHPLKLAFWQVTTALRVSHSCVPLLIYNRKIATSEPTLFLSFVRKPFPPILHQLKLQSTPCQSGWCLGIHILRGYWPLV